MAEDMQQVVALLTRAAEQGNTQAQFRLGVMYANADEVALDYIEAARWLGRAAAQGLAEAQSLMGWLCANGYGVPQDDAEAGRWYLRAAEAGRARDQYTVGAMYRWGRYGVAADPVRMLDGYQRSAQQQFGPAQLALGQLLMKDEYGIEKDYVLAYQWLSLAVVNGAENAGQVLESLTREMSPEQLAEAQRAMLSDAAPDATGPSTGGMGHAL
ncbi:MAG: tetratricopeptide repeat protein [Gammaproteobacteria bacterium]|nr:tetratricopeptide repeat protein [Gammaproteobacteria bacterium]